jgi:hypothetical protein
MSRTPIVTFRELHPEMTGYFDWLTTGFGMLHEQGRIDYRFQGLGYNWLRQANPKISSVIRRLLPGTQKKMIQGPPGFMDGTVQIADKRMTFTVDMMDTPYFVDHERLQNCDLYFKCQHPTTLDPTGFPINQHVRIPYDPRILAQQQKLRPGMLGRPLSRSLNYQKNLSILKYWEGLASTPRQHGLHVYFGTDEAPTGDGHEKYLVLFFLDRLQHPNPKRGELVRWVKQNLPTHSDARIVKSKDRAITGPALDDTSYPTTVASAPFNVNITGFRRSLPFRFIDSFIVGSAVPSDEMAVKWYLPFENEVEVWDLGRLGYEPAAEAEWTKAQDVLRDLDARANEIHAANHSRILALYQEKWHPRAFANYVVSECEKLL